MISINIADANDLETIQQLAHAIWPIAYKDVIKEEQIVFMLKQSYSKEAIAYQVNEGHVFLIMKEDYTPKGFASFSITEKPWVYKLQKLYLHQSLQGKGAGKLLINEVEKQVKNLGASQLILNVNRGNKAQYFYTKMGYTIIKTVDIPYFNYVLNDYIMAKEL
ncbi:GNAT family N-acetyltransferase [Pedobacter alpinus]|uniref:GNAT family N-acetyltransferase n=1 Tax=Pedobacter alpinus TaxID=1590643 RepID=A0ABW5TQB9_9SPHI